MSSQIKPDIICIKGADFRQTRPLIPSLDESIQITKFTFTHVRYTNQAKHDKYNPQINAIYTQG